jgi:hypothetical protein
MAVIAWLDLAIGVRLDYKSSSRSRANVRPQLFYYSLRSMRYDPRKVDTHWMMGAAVALGGLLLIFFVASGSVQRCFAAQNENEVERVVLTPARPQQPVSLRDRLVVGLQARLKTEVAFVEEVAFRVRIGQIPQRIVDQTFFWARDRASVVRAGRTRRPIIYFQPAMAARAKLLGVTL